MYGIHLNIHPSGGKNKYVKIHQKRCSSYKQHKGGQQKYSFNKNAQNMREAVETASGYSLEWHAPISFCSKCFPDKTKIECIF
jgi:hypothetical protein